MRSSMRRSATCLLRRRDVVFLLGGGAALALPRIAHAQTTVPVIGVLGGSTAKAWEPLLLEFRRGLGEAGFLEGHSVTADYRWADARYDLLPALAGELIQRKVSVLVAFT